MTHIEKEWDVFISHSSEDKDTIVREMATLLTKFGLKVWYDEFTLKVGDSLSQKIDEGLINSRFGIVIISRAFLNKKWTDYEYRSLLTREDNFKKVILPVWHNITFEEVKEFSLYLADRFALSTNNDSLYEISKRLLEIIRPDLYVNINRLMLYKKLISEAEVKISRVSDLHWGEKYRTNLSKRQINRIKSFYYSIGYLFGMSLTETLNCYLYDHNPEREIQIWEIINVTFLEFMEQVEDKDENKKKEVAGLLLLLSTGALSEDTTLNAKELSILYELWKENYYPY